MDTVYYTVGYIICMIMTLKIIQKVQKSTKTAVSCSSDLFYLPLRVVPPLVMHIFQP